MLFNIIEKLKHVPKTKLSCNCDTFTLCCHCLQIITYLKSKSNFDEPKLIFPRPVNIESYFYVLLVAFEGYRYWCI